MHTYKVYNLSTFFKIKKCTNYYKINHSNYNRFTKEVDPDVYIVHRYTKIRPHRDYFRLMSLYREIN